MQTHTPTSNISLSDWLAIKNFQQKHPQFSLEQIRWLIRTAPSDFDQVYTKVGKRIYLSEQRFAAWLEQKANGGRS